MKGKFLLIFGMVFFLFLVFDLKAQMQVERLDRGLVSVRKNQGYFLSWRLLAGEPINTGFNIYRGSTRLNTDPLVQATSYYDSIAPLNSIYYVRAIIDGQEQQDTKQARIINQNEGANAGYFDILIKRPDGGITPPYTVTNNGTLESFPNGQTYSYTAGDASTGDLDGDGVYDIVLKWDPSNARDNSHGGITGNVYLDGYTMSGEHLWRIDLGPNIRAGAHYTQFLVYDFDGNGRAEVMCKTAPGTKDASGNFISKGPAASANHNTVYRNASGYILSGPEYLTVFDGTTGEELATAEYWPLRGTVNSWGLDSNGRPEGYGNRVDRFNAAVAYVDGHRPSAIFQRGYYDKMTFAAWDWRDGRLTRRWTFNSKDTISNNAYSGQGNHSIHVIDANGDGKHDIVTGSSVISGDGNGMHTSGMGHGDATHVTFMKKNDPRPMIFMPHESGGHGVSLRYADNGAMIFNNRNSGDIGRGCAAELDPKNPGFHFWAASSMGLYNIEGQKVGAVPNSINFVIWWDGDLSRELMNSNAIDKWSISTNSSTRLLTGTNATSINGSKSTPVLQADLFGDWREEVILRLNDNKTLRVYTTTMPTPHKLYTFMHDPVYRVAVSWQNSSYNQPPHPGFYVASDMDSVPSLLNVAMIEGFNRGSGTLIKDLMVFDHYNASRWELMSALDNKTSVYNGRTFYASQMPDYLSGSEWIRTAFGSSLFAGSDLLGKFKAGQKATVSIVHQSSGANMPQWLAAYEAKQDKVVLTMPGQLPVEMHLYEKDFNAGETVELGLNGADQMYFVAARKYGVHNQAVRLKNEKDLLVFPNPINHYAEVSFTVPVDGMVVLDVLDLNGRKVLSLHEGFHRSGVYSLPINARSLDKGIYVLRYKTGSQTLQQKIVVSDR